MATIPVEKKAGTPWWLWLLGLLLLAGILFFFLRDKDEVDVVDTTEQPVATPVATTGLNLSDVWVTRVVGDKTFFVAPDSAGTDETLVYLEEDPTPGTATEGRYDVTAGQHISLTGTMMPIGDQDLTAWGLTAEQADMARMKPEYVRITALEQLGMMADGMMGDDTMTPVGPDAAMAPAAAPTTGTITTTEALYGTDLKPVIGRRVELDDATVLSVVGDSTFYVGSGGKRFLVALSGLGESQNGPGDGSDGVFKIEAGQKISLRGTVTAFDGANSSFRALSASDRTTATTRGAYVNVTRASDLAKK